MRILFVCTGNTCRSPMAEAVCREMMEREGIPGEARSAGLFPQPGDVTNPLTVQVLREQGIPFESKPAVPLTPEMLKSSDVVAVMTRQHAELLAQAFPAVREKLRVLEIPDPFGGGIAEYEQCFRRLREAVGELLAELPRPEKGVSRPDGVQSPSDGAPASSDAVLSPSDGTPSPAREAELRILPMTREQVPGAAALERACFSHPWSEAMLAEELDNPVSVFRAAVLDGRVIGYVGMQAAAREGYVANLAVDPAYRRRGAGRRLMSALLDYGRENGLEFISLEVRASNEGAIRLYEGLGFRCCGRRPRFYDDPVEDALLMTRVLREESAAPAD